MAFRAVNAMARAMSKKGNSRPSKKRSPRPKKANGEEMRVQGRSGRPTKYKPEYASQAKKLCYLGATNADLARFFEVDVTTVDLWIATHAEFSRSVKGGRQEADANVAKSLYRRAMGYSHNEEVIMQYQGVPLRVKTRKKYAPDTTAAIFWLKNRAKRDWRERIEHTGKDGAPLPMPVIQVLPPSGSQDT